jgi:uncharacterized protein YjbI with pentapeptide repeats
MSSDPNLTSAERRIMAAKGELVDLREGLPDLDDPARGGRWGDDRTVRASFLRDLLVQAREPAADRMSRSLRLRGARISGPLDLEHLELARPVMLQDCCFAEPVKLRQARAADVRLPGCHLPNLQAAQLEVRGNLILDGLTATSVNLHAARIGGILSLNGAHLDNPDGTTLWANRLTVGQNMTCGSGFNSTGMVTLRGANITGSLSFTGASLSNASAEQCALDAQGMKVSYALFVGSSNLDPGGFNARGGLRLVGVQVDGFVCCWDAHIAGLKQDGQTSWAIAGNGLTVSANLNFNRGFAADGEIDLTYARIGGQINFAGATLSNPQGRALTAEGLVTGGPVLCTNGFTARGEVSLERSKIGGSLDFTGAILSEPVGNAVDLQDATAAMLIARWTAPPDLVDLRHAKITGLADDPASWPERLRLREFSYETLDPDLARSVSKRLAWIRRDVEGYIPQPYEELIAAYRRSGHEEAARAVAITKQRRRCQVLGPAAKAWNWLLYLTVGYGYRTWQAGLWLLALELAGTVAFARAYPAHMIAATRHPMPFNAPVYALDVLLPIISLGQENSWRPQGGALYVYWTLIILGWVLTSAFIAGLTGIIKRS